MNKSKLFAAIIALSISTGAVASVERNLSPEEYGLLREAGVATSCYDMGKAELEDLQIPGFKLYMMRPDIGKALSTGNRTYIIGHMDNVQFEDFTSIRHQVSNDPDYYCSKFQK